MLLKNRLGIDLYVNGVFTGTNDVVIHNSPNSVTYITCNNEQDHVKILYDKQFPYSFGIIFNGDICAVTSEWFGCERDPYDEPIIEIIYKKDFKQWEMDDLTKLKETNPNQYSIYQKYSEYFTKSEQLGFVLN